MAYFYSAPMAWNLTAVDKRGQRSTFFKGEDVPANLASRDAVQNVANLETEISLRISVQ